jgi:hypothetical protein
MAQGRLLVGSRLVSYPTAMPLSPSRCSLLRQVLPLPLVYKVYLRFDSEWSFQQAPVTHDPRGQ